MKHPGIQINKLNKRGSALHLAVSHGHVDVVLTLLKSKACCVLEDFCGKIPLELATDKEIIELIPKFQGNWELEKYENKEKPPQFAGNLMIYNTFRISDKQVFLFINLELGMLEEFESKDHFLAKKSPNSSMRIVDIQQVVPVKTKLWLVKTVCYFEIVSKVGNKYYYTKHDEFRDE